MTIATCRPAARWRCGFGGDWGAHLVGRPNAPTADKLWHEVPGKLGERIGDYYYFAHHPEARPGAGARPG